MRKITMLAVGAALLSTAPAGAVVNNLVTNGSFENGLAGWGISGSDGQNFPPVAIFYNNNNPYPNGAFGELIPADNSGSLSPDAPGTRAAYFVSDLANPQILSQFVTLGPGRYRFGLSTYAPANGLRNAGDARFQATFFGITVADFMLSSQPAQTWQHFAGTFTKTTFGTGSINLGFSSNFVPSKDIVIDRVYVAAVPEPASWAMLIGGFGLVGLMRRRASSPAVVSA